MARNEKLTRNLLSKYLLKQYLHEFHLTPVASRCGKKLFAEQGQASKQKFADLFREKNYCKINSPVSFKRI